MAGSATVRAVVNGTTIPATELQTGGAYQWLAALEIGGNTMCSGTLVAPDYVLTAAHCLNGGVPDVRIGGLAIAVSDFQVHPLWRGVGTVEYDAALLHLAQSAGATPLPVSVNPGDVVSGGLVGIQGWGFSAGIPAPAAGTMRVTVVDPTIFQSVPAQASVCGGDSGSGVIVGTPGVDARLVGIATFASNACDLMGAVASTAVSEWLLPIIDPAGGPKALSGSVGTTLNKAVQIPMEFTSETGQPLPTSAIVAVRATHGTVTSCSQATTSPTACTFTPATNFVGLANFSFDVRDAGRTSTGTWSITVVNQSPTAQGGSLSTAQDTPVDVPMVFSDPDGTPLSIGNLVGATMSHVAISGCSGTVPPFTCTAVPDAGYVGPASFDYTVSDGIATASAHWDIQVTAVGPTVRVASVRVDEPREGRRPITVLVSLSQASTMPVTVTIIPRDGSAQSGRDYIAEATTLRIKPGLTQATYRAFILADRLAEPDETFVLTVSAQNASVGTPTATVTIAANPARGRDEGKDDDRREVRDRD